MNLKALCKEANLEFYDSELTTEKGKKIYRIYVMKEGGVNLDDCARLSEILSPIFAFSFSFSLVVIFTSSLMLFWKCSNLLSFLSSPAEDTSKKYSPLTGEKEKLKAKILSVENENIHLENLENQEKITLNFNDIKKARTFVEW